MPSAQIEVNLLHGGKPGKAVVCTPLLTHSREGGNWSIYEEADGGRRRAYMLRAMCRTVLQVAMTVHSRRLVVLGVATAPRFRRAKPDRQLTVCAACVTKHALKLRLQRSDGNRVGHALPHNVDCHHINVDACGASYVRDIILQSHYFTLGLTAFSTVREFVLLLRDASMLPAGSDMAAMVAAVLPARYARHLSEAVASRAVVEAEMKALWAEAEAAEAKAAAEAAEAAAAEA
eukprot:6195765-Pleurochrysis_carterae.AAC.1